MSNNLRLGIDCDGVLACFESSYLAVANKLWPGRIDIPGLTPDKFTCWNWPEEVCGLTKEENSRVWEEIKETPNFWLLEEPIADNVGAMREFLYSPIGRCSSVYYVTSRVPTQAGMNVLYQTTLWLEKYGLNKMNTSVVPVVHMNNSGGLPPKLAVIQTLGIDAHIDDYLPTVIDLKEKGALLDRAWNRSGRPNDVAVFSSLKNFLDAVSCWGNLENE